MASLSRDPPAPSSQSIPPIHPSFISASPADARGSAAAAEQPELSSLANEGLKASSNTTTTTSSTTAPAAPIEPPANRLKRALPFDPPVLTGAGALADRQRHRYSSPQPIDEAKRHRAQMTTTPNPALMVKDSLLGQSSPVTSRPNDHSTSPFPAQRQSTPPQPTTKATPLIRLTETATTVAEPMQMEQTSPVSMTEEESAALRNSRGVAGPNGQDTPRLMVSASDHHPHHNNKALTYPPPQSPAEEVPGRSRTLSYPNPASAPGSATRGSGKKHKCPNCETEFTRHHNLKSHLLTHSQEKPYVCTHCDAKFRRLHDLKRHSKLHTGERNHICPMCHRRFARGDALARHSKGPAGCAGRRSSGAGGDEDDGGSNNGESMDGIVYSNDPGDDDPTDPRRRRSEPQRKSTAPMRSDTGPPPYRTSVTSSYPPVANMMSAPPRSSASQASLTHGQLSVNGPHFGSVQYSSPGSFSQQAGVVESPKPLSPSQPDPRRLSASEVSRGRSPSLAQQMQQSHFNRGSGRGTPPLNLPPPAHAGPPGQQQLPSLPSMTAADPRANVFHPQGGGRLGSNAGPVLPSQNGSSIGHRDEQGDVMSYIKEVEARMHEQMAAELRKQKAEYEGRITQLQDEIAGLRSTNQSQAGGEGVVKAPLAK